MVDRLIMLIIAVMTIVGDFFSTNLPLTFLFGAVFALSAGCLVTMK